MTETNKVLTTLLRIVFKHGCLMSFKLLFFWSVLTKYFNQ